MKVYDVCKCATWVQPQTELDPWGHSFVRIWPWWILPTLYVIIHACRAYIILILYALLHASVLLQYSSSASNWIGPSSHILRVWHTASNWETFFCENMTLLNFTEDLVFRACTRWGLTEGNSADSMLLWRLFFYTCVTSVMCYLESSVRV